MLHSLMTWIYCFNAGPLLNHWFMINIREPSGGMDASVLAFPQTSLIWPSAREQIGGRDLLSADQLRSPVTPLGTSVPTRNLLPHLL